MEIKICAGHDLAGAMRGVEVLLRPRDSTLLGQLLVVGIDHLRRGHAFVHALRAASSELVLLLWTGSNSCGVDSQYDAVGIVGVLLDQPAWKVDKVAKRFFLPPDGANLTIFPHSRTYWMPRRYCH